MNRRTVIKSYLALSAGFIFLPACLQDKRKSSTLLANIQITGDQELMLSNLVEVILPKTSSPGGKDLSSHRFALMMVDECFDPEAQKKFVIGLQQFESAADDRFGVSFSETSPVQKAELLKALENKTGMTEETLFFYQTIKELTIESFVSSQYFLTKIHIYEMAPGRFHGCFPVTNVN